MSVNLHRTKNKKLLPGEPKWYEIVIGRGENRIYVSKQFETHADAKIYECDLQRQHKPTTIPAIAPPFSEMIPGFLKYYENELERRPRAIESWLQGWNNLQPFFGNLKITFLTPDHIEQYKAKRLSQKAGIRNNNVSKRTIQKELHNLSSLIKYAVEKNLCEPLPFKIKGFMKKNMKPKPIVIPTPEQVQEMFKVTKQWRPDLLPLYHLVYYTGFRSDEARHIKVSNVNFEWGTILIQGKGGKWRFMPIVNELLPTIKELCEGKGKDDYLLISKRTGKPYSANCGKMDKAAAAAGISTHITLHVLRKCFATHCLYWGMDMRTVQILLGHEDIKTTETYTPLPPSFLAAQMARASETSRHAEMAGKDAAVQRTMDETKKNNRLRIVKK